MNTYNDKNSDLSSIDYDFLLDEILKNTDNIEIFNNKNTILFKNFNEICFLITKNILKSNVSLDTKLKLRNSYFFNNSVNFFNEKSFREKVKEINREIQKKLDNINKEDFKIDYLESYKNEKYKGVNFGVESDFKEIKLEKSKMTNEKYNKKLKLDEVTISIETKEIYNNLKKSIISYLDKQNLDVDFKENLIDDLQENNLELKNLIYVLDSESLARIKRTISYKYLEIIAKNSQNKYLNDYVRRFYLFDELLYNLSQKSQNETKIMGIDILSLFTKGDAFDKLPIIGVFNGNTFENNDEYNKSSKFSIKIKLNGTVNENKKQSFDYHLNSLIDKENLRVDSVLENHKRMKIYFLYIFMFKDLGDENFNPIELFDRVKKFIEKDTNHEERFQRLIIQLINNNKNTNKIVQNMSDEIRDIISDKKFNINKNFNLNIVVNKSIMGNENDFERFNLFKVVSINKDYLKYITITNKVNANKSLFSTKVEVNIKSEFFYNQEESDEFKAFYEIKNKRVLPIILYRKEFSEKLKEIFNTQDNRKDVSLNDNDKNFKGQNNSYINNINISFKEVRDKTLKDKFCIYIPSIYEEDLIKDDKTYFIYNLVFTILSFIILENILKKLELDKQTYIPIIRHHNKFENKQSSRTDNLISNYSKILNHMLSKKYISNSQGFDISKDYNKNISFNYKNAMSSLYSNMEKHFENVFNIEKQKIAIVVVSSVKSDYSKSENKLATIFGEVTLFDRNDNYIDCKFYSSFSDNLNYEDIYSKPTILRDIITQIYKKGYKDILYISKAPHISNLNITKKKNLYFLNENLIKYIKSDFIDLNIYPLYFDNYYVIDYSKENKKAFYTDFHEEIYHLKDNYLKSSLTVFNLFSGKEVNKKENFYKSMASYKTLYNMYEDNKLNLKIAESLISQTNIKNDLISALFIYHFSKYEGSNNQNIKINPYIHLIGDEGLTYISKDTYNISKNIRLNFNMLSFLIEIDKSLCE